MAAAPHGAGGRVASCKAALPLSAATSSRSSPRAIRVGDGRVTGRLESCQLEYSISFLTFVLLSSRMHYDATGKPEEEEEEEEVLEEHEAALEDVRERGKADVPAQEF